MNGKYAAGLEKLLVPLEKLQQDPDNPRRGDVAAVAKSYATFGQRKPIVVRKEEDGTGTVIAGNHQFAAAKTLGWDKIAVVWVEEDAETSRAFALADNRTHDIGVYDTEALIALIEEVSGEENLLAATSYSEDDLSDLVARFEEDTVELDTEELLKINARFSSMATRMFVVTLTNDQFVAAQDMLAKYRAHVGVESNAEAAVKAIADVTGKVAPKWN